MALLGDGETMDNFGDVRRESVRGICKRVCSALLVTRTVLYERMGRVKLYPVSR